MLLGDKLLSEEYINSLPGLFYVFDEQRFVRWNSEWERVTGYNAEELGAMYGTDFFDGEDQILIGERMRTVFRDGASEAEAELLTKDGHRIPYYFTGLRKMFDGKDHIVGLGIDVTDRKHAQREREELISRLESQNAELERFTYTVSHDLKSPLITIKGYAGMLGIDLAEGDTGADILVVSASGGPPRRITTAPSPDTRPSWSRDGRWIYFASHRRGEWQVWKAPSGGKEEPRGRRQTGGGLSERGTHEHVPSRRWPRTSPTSGSTSRPSRR